MAIFSHLELFKFNKCQGNLMDRVVAKSAQQVILSLMSLFLQGDNIEYLQISE